MRNLKNNKALKSRRNLRLCNQCRLIAESAKRIDTSLEGLTDAVYGIAESLDFMASEYRKPLSINQLSEAESNAIYNTLKNLYVDGLKMQPSSQDFDMAMQRILFISKGWCFNG